VGELVGLLAGGGVCGTAVAFVWIVWASGRADRRDDDAMMTKLRDQHDREQADHRAERTRLQAVIDDERAKRRTQQDEADQRIREAEEDVARLRRLVRELGGDPG
jgi:flagellar motility protein MotE (MotC chaperone)